MQTLTLKWQVQLRHTASFDKLP